MKHLYLATFWIFAAASSFGQLPDRDFHLDFTKAMESGRIQEAIAIGENWQRNHPKEVDSYYYTSKGLAKTGRNHEAAENLKKALSLDSAHVPSLLAAAQISKRNNEGKALEYFEKLIVLNPSNAFFYREAAESAKETQKFDKAIAYYSLAYQLDSLDLITVTGFAQLLIDFNQVADADSLLNRALFLDPSNRFARLTKAKLALSAEEWENVLEWLEPMMEASPPLTALRYAGISLYHLGRYDRSIDILRTLSNTVNELDYPHYYMGLCMEKSGQTELAEVQYGQALNKALSGNLGAYYERLGLMQQANGNHKEAIETFLMAKNFSGKNIINFHLAKSYDVYYQDQKVAIEMFETFVAREDTLQSREREYAENRVNQLKKVRHFEGR